MARDEETSPDRSSHGRQRASRRIDFTQGGPRPARTTNNVYLGSYSQSSRSQKSSEVPPSPRATISHVQLEPLLREIDVELDAFGVDEQRDGYFDAPFFRPIKQDRDEMMYQAQETLPEVFRRPKQSSIAQSFWRQIQSLKYVWKDVTTTRSGIRLFKAFLGFFVAYIICLIPASRDWLGKYSYIMVVSTIINHSGRTVGSQIDGAIFTIIGTALGIGWGSLALYVSTSTTSASEGYGGVLATFLILFTASISWVRSIFIRFYQAIICAGIAICYTCLADTSNSVGWHKVSSYIIPWTLGQAINLIVCSTVFPTSGTRALA